MEPPWPGPGTAPAHGPCPGPVPGSSTRAQQGNKHPCSGAPDVGLNKETYFLAKPLLSPYLSHVGGLTENFPVNSLTGKCPLSRNGEFPVKPSTRKFPVKLLTGN